ncbi:MAG: SinR family protein [Verrucomicrobia bacterium]|nr:SinR family protein [Verrucomicrobiota bacterium]
MKTLIISYDLHKPLQNYDQLIQKIRAYGNWAKLGGSAYLIVTGQTPSAVRDNLMTALDSNDVLFVSTCPVPSAWKGLPEEVAKWILENQPKNS